MYYINQIQIPFMAEVAVHCQLLLSNMKLISSASCIKQKYIYVSEDKGKAVLNPIDYNIIQGQDSVEIIEMCLNPTLNPS